MSNDHEKTWEIYTSSWKAESSEEKKTIFNECLDSECQYCDPLIKTTGWEELVLYMLDFHQQVPGGYFVTNYFLAHSNQSIAQWEMKNADDDIIGKGASYGQYNKNGKLVTMTGFFQTP